MAFGLALSFDFFICTSPVIGFNQTISTLVSQALGRKNAKECVLHFNTGRVFICFLTPVLIALSIFSNALLQTLMYDQLVSKLAMHYLIGLTPGIFAFSQFDALRALLLGMGKTSLPLFVQLLTTFFHFGFSRFLI